MSTIELKKPPKSYATVWVCVFAVLYAALIASTWYFIILYSARQRVDNKSEITQNHQTRNPLNGLKADKTKTYRLTEDDLVKFNNHIEYLTANVRNEVERTQKNAEYDINRINTFLTIGIGLLAIIGGLLPLVVNFFSKEHLENRLIVLESNVETVVEKISPVAAKVETTTKEFDLISKKIPYITSLVLQNAVARLLSVNNIRYYTEGNRNEKLSNVLQGVIDAINKCKDDHSKIHMDENYHYLITVIKDLKIGLQSPVRLSLPKKIQKLIDGLGQYLDNFTFENRVKFQILFEETSLKLSTIKNSIDQLP